MLAELQKCMISGWIIGRTLNESRVGGFQMYEILGHWINQLTIIKIKLNTNQFKDNYWAFLFQTFHYNSN